MVKAVFPEHAYITLELPEERQQAIEDPRGLLARGARYPGLIIDEAQRAPQLFSYLQVAADESPPGRFILTGSQNFLLMENLSQTLAGRVGLLHLLPFSLPELLQRQTISEEMLLEDITVAPPDASLWQVIWRGFYPRIHDRNLEVTHWLADYTRTYIERDLRQVMRVMDLDVFQRFLQLTAAHTAKELNLNALASDTGISHVTARQWLGALQVGFLVTTIPPYLRSFRKRLRKRPKLHLLDSGLACYLLGIRDPESLERHPLRGAIFESFVVSELVKLYEHAAREASLFFWRDATGNEIDVVIERSDSPIPVEVKSGQTVAADALDRLRWWLSLPENPARAGVLVHGGDFQGRRGDVAIRPWYFTLAS